LFWIDISDDFHVLVVLDYFLLMMELGYAMFVARLGDNRADKGGMSWRRLIDQVVSFVEMFRLYFGSLPALVYAWHVIFGDVLEPFWRLWLY